MLNCERLRALAGERRRPGYGRLHVLLRREGRVVNRKNTQRLYREEGRKKATGTRTPLLTVALPNARWSVNLVHDQFTQGLRFHIFNVIDDVIKECLAAVVDTSVSGSRMARGLKALVARRGRPDCQRPCTEFTSNASWSVERGRSAIRRLMQRSLGNLLTNSRHLEMKESTAFVPTRI